MGSSCAAPYDPQDGGVEVGPLRHIGQEGAVQQPGLKAPGVSLRTPVLRVVCKRLFRNCLCFVVCRCSEVVMGNTCLQPPVLLRQTKHGSVHRAGPPLCRPVKTPPSSASWFLLMCFSPRATLDARRFCIGHCKTPPSSDLRGAKTMIRSKTFQAVLLTKSLRSASNTFFV